jgi:DNA-binding GntR family transcriptional regulator
MGNNKKNTEIYQSIMNYRFVATKLSLISKEMVESALEQHYTIIDAVKSGKPRVMRDVIRLHLEDSKNRLLEKIKNNGGSI